MLELARDGLIVLAVWLVAFFALTGLGRWLRPRFDSLDSFWLGLAICLIFLQLWHFVAPVNVLPAGVIAVVGLAGWLRRPYQSPRLKPLLWLLPLLFVLAVFATTGIQASPIGMSYNTALYEIPNVIWNNTYPIIPGLANLHDRFGFNSSFLLLAAQFEQFPGGSTHYPVGILVLPMLLAVARSIGRLARRESGNVDWVQVGFAIPLAVHLVIYDLSLFDTDFISFIVGSTLAVRLLSVIERAVIRDDDALLLIVLAAIGVTFKLSFIVFAAACVAVVLLHYRPARRGTLAAAAILALVLVGGWMLRNVVISGYPLFPASVAPAPVDWQVPKAITDDTANWVYSWARIRGAGLEKTLGTFAWIPQWYRNNRTDPKLVNPALLAAAGLVLLALRRRKLPARLLLYFLPHALALVFWFLTAPDPRFTEAILWGLALGLFVPATAGWKLRPLLIVPAFGLCFYYSARSFPPLKIDPFGPSRYMVFETKVTQSGLVVHLPSPVVVNRCYRIPLPCTPNFRDNLELRVPDNMAGGFRLSDSTPESAVTTPEPTSTR